MAKMRCGHLFDVIDYNVLGAALVFSLSALLHSNSISKLFFGIVVSVGLLIDVTFVLTSCKKPDSKGINCFSRLFSVDIICIRLWCSCVLGLMSFVDISGIQNDFITAITWMLVASIGVKAIWSFMQRCLGLIKYSTRPILMAELLELVGFLVPGLILLPEDHAILSKYALFLILFFLGFTVVAFRLITLSYNGIPFFILIVIAVCCQVGLYIYFNSSFGVHDAALCCFTYRLLIDPVFDFLFRKPSRESPSKIVINQ